MKILRITPSNWLAAAFEVPVVDRAPIDPRMATSKSPKQRASASYTCARLPRRQDAPEGNSILGMTDAAISGRTLSTNSARTEQ
jgi:hypothetical protein